VFALFSSNPGSLARLSQVHNCVSILAPNYYHAAMTLGTVSGRPDQASLTTAGQCGLPLWPVVNSSAYAPALGTSAVIEKLASGLAQTAIAGGYAGLTLDCEDLPPADQRAFTSLVQQTAALLHARNIKLADYTVRPNKGDGA
jgi:spore germination protein YaaH